MAVAYLVCFILGATSGLIHPACYAYVGAVLPLLFALIYLYTCTMIRGFGAATVLKSGEIRSEFNFGIEFVDGFFEKCDEVGVGSYLLLF